ncbi:MAG: Gfo/Idh/MocA family oxidoreductase, partial [Planctomycetes bacterium]|nr:Gfo/Idh/MocA family oxidoreductase [Planctomycetota bacterium]
MERRDFLKRSTGAAAALGLSVLGRREGWAAPSETLRIGIVGVRGRGGDHLRGFIGLPGVQIAAICDVDEGATASRVKEVVDRGKPRPQSYVDMRYLFDDKTIDAVSFATPNHWHAL